MSEHRSRSVGSALLDEAISHAQRLSSLRQIVLTVTASNVAACSLYKSRGFELFGLERDALFIDGMYLDQKHLVLTLAP
ncbi:MAG: GNAT family N-acetyltransferase [Nostocales cyanobacterium 94392]|nr:GNAT family N-acetyltransferase [Nostocales cyanobacterium 94392]